MDKHFFRANLHEIANLKIPVLQQVNRFAAAGFSSVALDQFFQFFRANVALLRGK